MLTQYLVGLCCVRRNPDAVDVTVGDMVLDAAAQKDRDVDVTVTVKEADGTTSAFRAYEVKREAGPLDVATVEQLCMKLRDMPAITHRAIVSASGFTSGAVAKATTHGVELLSMKPWLRPIAEQFPAFPGIGKPEDFLRGFDTNLLIWVMPHLFLQVPKGPSSFSVEGWTPIFDSEGGTHNVLATFGQLQDKLLMRSTEILFPLEPAHTIMRAFPSVETTEGSLIFVGPDWPHTHTLDTRADGLFLKFGETIASIDYVTITGSLQWQKQAKKIDFYILEPSSGGAPFAGTAIGAWGTPDEKMFAMIFSPDSRAIDIHHFHLEEKHRNAIRRLKLLVER